jgi:hypothetical protein
MSRRSPDYATEGRYIKGRARRVAAPARCEVCLVSVPAIPNGHGARADDLKPSDEGKAAEFKGKTFDLKAKGEAAILLTCAAGKEVTATTKGEKETDVHLFIYAEDKKEVGKDTSPGPKCEVKFTQRRTGSSSCSSATSALGPTT